MIMQPAVGDVIRAAAPCRQRDKKPYKNEKPGCMAGLLKDEKLKN
ncbi:MAG: hypothetical protein Q8R95_05190 [Azonexus sp.]|nr:hypothetical protein [Azonexus sp.]